MTVNIIVVRTATKEDGNEQLDQEEKARALGADDGEDGDNVMGDDTTANGGVEEDNATDGRPVNPDFGDAAVPLGAAGKREMDDSGDDDDDAANQEEELSTELGADC